MNTYHTHPDQPGTIYKTQDPNVRRFLISGGWQKQRRDDLERIYTRYDLEKLADAPDGCYVYLTKRPDDYRALRFTLVSTAI
jgi:hypothetical protein